MKKSILLFLFIVLVRISVFAQPPPPNDGVDDIPAPIDNHIWIVMLLGLILGLYFIFSKKSVLRN
ncbi:hypothetical protein ACFQ0R_07500 [Psychroflexus salinarum]|uniref:PEP-CTERM protein-sorting domain-containing protein n=1 Tax=Psychroflexus salinarum TaxID=546024 RepID=A0ABW3GUG6_9FLAO